MSYIEVADLAEAASFRTRVKVAIVTAAVNVLAEDTSSMTETKASKRNALATAVLTDPQSFADRFAWPVVANPSIAANGLASPDGDLAFVVSSVWNAMAGVNSTDQ